MGVAGSYLGYALQSAFLGSEKRKAKLKSTHTRAGQKMRAEMQSLRGPAMKLGQTLSLHSGIIPDETLLELSKLQMEAPGMHAPLMRAQFRGSMGRDPEDVFREFDPKPFAAASLGQVHRAVTRKGDQVAVKIQYPGIREAIENDFSLLRTASRPAQVAGYLPRSIINELHQQIIAETDYKREADNIEYFAEHLKPLPFMKVPKVYRDFSSDQVLTMSLLPGQHMQDFMAQRPSQKRRDQIGTHLFDLYYFQLMKVEAFHADPNHGNYLFGDDGSIGLVDFGCVKYINSEFAADLRSLYLYPGPRDSAHFRTVLEARYVRFGIKLNSAARRALVDFAQNFYKKVYPPDPEKDSEPFDFGQGTVLRDYIRESQKLLRGKGITPEYVLLGRAEMGLYDMLHRLRARVHTSRIVRKYLAK